MSPRTTALLLLTLWTSLEEGLCAPPVLLPPEPAGVVSHHRTRLAWSHTTEPAGVVSHHRTRRCSCNSRLDSECHYFCHLDIIWVNTQSKTSLYGLGGSGPRRRRAAARCSCGSPSDRTCSRFCDHSLNIHPPESSSSRPPAHLLHVLRDLAEGSHVQGAVDLRVETAVDPPETKVG